MMPFGCCWNIVPIRSAFHGDGGSVSRQGVHPGLSKSSLHERLMRQTVLSVLHALVPFREAFNSI